MRWTARPLRAALRLLLQEELLEVARLQLGPGDVLVVRCAEVLTAQRAEQLSAQVRAVVGERPVMILAAGYSLAAWRGEDAATLPGGARGVFPSRSAR